MKRKAILLVLDSVGIGEAPDAADYGDAGANTLAHIGRAVGGLRLPVLRRLGLGNIPPLLPAGLPIMGVEAVASPEASFGAMREMSRGKDTTTGHWEMAGLELPEGLGLFPPGPPSFPAGLISEFERRTGRGTLGNRAFSGTAIIAELGEEHMRTGRLIVYTSADSVFQVAAHEDVVPVAELYRACGIARELCNPYRVGRVIARPFVGAPGGFRRTTNRRDFSYPLPGPTILDRLAGAGIPVVGVGKIEDVFSGRGISCSARFEDNPRAEEALLGLSAAEDGLVFVNLIDFDMLYGHRRDPAGYARALEKTDGVIGRLLPALAEQDLLIITADHGNDPTFRGTDHTRELAPLLVYRPGVPGRSLGIRQGFYDVAQSLASFFGVPPMPRGTCF